MKWHIGCTHAYMGAYKINLDHTVEWSWLLLIKWNLSLIQSYKFGL